MRLIFVGTPEVALPSLEALIAAEHEVVAVITRPDARTGRGRALTPSPVKVAANALGIPVLTPARADDPEFLEQLRELAPQACAVVAYGALLGEEALAIPEHGWINLHFSLLPQWRGAAPVQRAIMAGDEITGACTFQIEKGLDSGPVYGSLTRPIGEGESAGELLSALAESGADLLAATISGIEDGSLVAVPQTGEVSLAPKLTTAEAAIRWATPAPAIDRHVRGCTPEPGAWSSLAGTRLALGPINPRPELPADLPSLQPGQIHATKKAVFVGTLTTAIQLGTVCPPGKKPMAAADWARGARLDAGSTFAQPEPATEETR